MKNKMIKISKSIVVSLIAFALVVSGVFCTNFDTEAAETVANVDKGVVAAITVNNMSADDGKMSFITKTAYPAGSTVSFDILIPENLSSSWWGIGYSTSPDNASIYNHDSAKMNCQVTIGEWSNCSFTLPEGTDNYYIYFLAAVGEWPANGAGKAQEGEPNTIFYLDSFKVTDTNSTVLANETFDNGYGIFNVIEQNAQGNTAVELCGVNGTKGVIYVQYENMDYSQYVGEKAPKYTGVDENGVGYLFGGWYAKNGNTYTAIENLDDLTTTEAAAATVVAKFVPAQTLSVKCQNWAGTDATSDKVIIRVVSGTDSKNYQEFGFNVSRIDGGTETKFNPFPTDTVYKKFNYYDSASDTEPDTYVPSDLFGDSAKYFTTCTVGKIPVGKHGTIICIQPYWKTLDGVQVNGLTKYAHVEDGYLHYVNVPVNLNVLINDSATAGVLSVKAPEGLTFLGVEKGVEVGRTFEEMEFNVLEDGTIKCAGNTSDAKDKTGMDIYINLKFKRAEEPSTDAPAKGEFLTFTVEGEDFADSEPTKLNEPDVWNVIY